MPSVLLIVGVTVGAVLATGGLVDAARRWSLRLALLDTPNARSSNSDQARSAGQARHERFLEEQTA